MGAKSLTIVLLCLATSTLAAGVERPTTARSLAGVKTWMYQLQNIEDPKAVERLAQSDYDLLVIEPTTTIKDQKNFDITSVVARLHETRPGRIVLAYLDVGEAENYRSYWANDWVAPTKTTRGRPDFLIIPDPDGWSGDYPVAYWDNRWQKLLAAGDDSHVRQIMRAGFDGLYLDWVDGYDDDAIVAEAKRQKVDPAKAMVEWIGVIRAAAREVNPSAVIVPQNAIYLSDRDPRYMEMIDALGVEDTWFSGKSNAKWGSAKGGDIANKAKDEMSTARRIAQYQKYLTAGKPVFTVDYCLKPQNVAKAYAEARTHGLIPLVTQVSLERMTETPPTTQAGDSTTAPASRAAEVIGLDPGWALVRHATYTASQTPDDVIIKAIGENPTAGYETKLIPSRLRIWPPQFLVAHKKPEGMAAEVITPFEVTASFKAKDRVATIVVTDAAGRHEVKVEQARD